ncbi:unnamed protein product [Cuscuta epithymum]|uniref:Phytocyanin domain-containing protein n=1 Tax=Cuscuta epithymum TaxID=186058 RepID=A0AAV0GHG8_9ASTE|nr:unnamed protein product [Cuscuta epithymum]
MTPPSSSKNRNWLMGKQACKVVMGVLIAACWMDPRACGVVEHRVGGEEWGWTIPPHHHFYGNWSSSRSFRPGDTLLFDFDPVFYNLIQVSNREYDACTANQPFQAFTDHAPPLIIPLRESGVFYYLCSLLNYCSLGLKLNVSVQPPTPSPLPPPNG